MGAGFAGGFGHVAGADDVVLHGFVGVSFHQGHVLVGGGVEEDGGLVAGDGGAQFAVVADIANDGCQDTGVYMDG